MEICTYSLLGTHSARNASDARGMTRWIERARTGHRGDIEGLPGVGVEIWDGPDDPVTGVVGVVLVHEAPVAVIRDGQLRPWSALTKAVFEYDAPLA